jgi:hypothetical protein
MSARGRSAARSAEGRPVSRRPNKKDDLGASLVAYRALIADAYELAGLSRRTSDELAREVGHAAAR